MDSELEAACQRVGWAALYEQLAPGLGPESPRGERDASSPFPFSGNDSSPSFRVNMRSGLWRDWHAEQASGVAGGNFVQFLAFMAAPVEAGRPVRVDYEAAERDLRVALGLSRPVDPVWLAACQAALAADERAAALWAGLKPWTAAGLATQGVGWDSKTNRLVLPSYSQDGRLANCRMYKPGAAAGEPKMWWKAPGLQGNYLFPAAAKSDRWAVLCEGETDALTLRLFGFNGASGSMGCEAPVPEGDWWRGKDVFVLMDKDAHGREASIRAGEVLRHGAASVVLCELPAWPDEPSNADVSDYVMSLAAAGRTFAETQQAIREVLTSGLAVVMPSKVYDQPAVDVSFAQAASSMNANRRIRWDAHVAARSSVRYKLPTRVVVTCPAGGHSYCKSCPMAAAWGGSHAFQLEPRAQASLKLVAVDEDKQRVEMLRLFELPQKCPDVRLDVVESEDLEPVMLAPTTVESESNSVGLDRERSEAFVLASGGRVDDGSDFRFEGFVYPLPKSQKQVLFVASSERLASDLDDFELADGQAEALDAAFSPPPGQDAWAAIQSAADEVAATTTLIYGRRDLHLMYRTVWFSVVSFMFGGSPVLRGWIEALVVGDTRCGKSHTFRKMAALYGAGLLVDCKMQTPAGMLGAVETSSLTGERYVVAGVLPRQDRRGPIGMDEFAASVWDRSSIMDHMSSTRAEGRVVISKAASASFWARVRSVWMANPGMGRMMSELGFNGVELIPRLIRQPEDVARFDMAMAVSQEDVPPEEINRPRELARPAVPAELHRAHLAWAWSRRPEQVVWAAGAEDAVYSLSTSMYNKYDKSIPLVEPADQKTRVAKTAVSIAAQVFSTRTGSELVVEVDHVVAASRLFGLLYNSKPFGYDAYSAKVGGERWVEDEAEVRAALDAAWGDKAPQAVNDLLRMHEFTENAFAMLTTTPIMAVRRTLQVLLVNRCIRLARATYRDLYEVTPQFVAFLKGYREQKVEEAREAAHA